MWFRVDNRLVHGQVIEAWLPYTGARHLVVANDALAADPVRQQIVQLAVPPQVSTHFVPLSALAQTLDACGEECFVLFANCQDARRACSCGVQIPVLNMGNLHYSPEKMQLLPHIALSSQDRDDLHYMQNHMVELDFRCIPTEKVRGLNDPLF